MLDFVRKLFEPSKEPKVAGIHIKMKSGNIIKVELVPASNRVNVYMDNKNMGFFEYIDNKRIYIFHQKNREGISKGLTEQEALIKNICDTNELIDFYGT